MIEPGTKVKYVIAGTARTGIVLVYVPPITGEPARVLVSQDLAPTTQRLLPESAVTVTAPAPVVTKKGYSSLNVGYEPAKQAAELTAMYAAGCRIVRIDMPWSVIEGTKGGFNIAKHEAAVNLAISKGFEVLGIICYFPRWLTGGANDKVAPTSPDTPRLFGEHCGRLATYFKGRVGAYELGNEPNIRQFWWPSPNQGGPEMMAKMLIAARPLIRDADPAALVLTPGTSPAKSDGTDVDPRDYVPRLYAAGAKGSFDAVAHHCYYGPNSLYVPKDWSAWHQMFVPKGVDGMLKPSLRQTMIANGDDLKLIWGTEANMLVQPGKIVEGFEATEERQAVMMTEVLTAWKEFRWTGPIFIYNWQGHYPLYSLKRDDGSIRPAYQALKDAAA